MARPLEFDPVVVALARGDLARGRGPARDLEGLALLGADLALCLNAIRGLIPDARR